MSLDSSITPLNTYQVTDCLIGSSSFEGGIVSFYDPFLELIATDATGSTTSPLTVPYEIVNSFKLIKLSNRIRVEVPEVTVADWAAHNGFDFDNSQTELREGACVTIFLEFSADDFAHFLREVASVLHESHIRARSTSRVSVAAEPMVTFKVHLPPPVESSPFHLSAQLLESQNKDQQKNFPLPPPVPLFSPLPTMKIGVFASNKETIAPPVGPPTGSNDARTNQVITMPESPTMPLIRRRDKKNLEKKCTAVVPVLDDSIEAMLPSPIAKTAVRPRTKTRPPPPSCHTAAADEMPQTIGDMLNHCSTVVAAEQRSKQHVAAADDDDYQFDVDYLLAETAEEGEKEVATKKNAAEVRKKVANEKMVANEKKMLDARIREQASRYEVAANNAPKGRKRSTKDVIQKEPTATKLRTKLMKPPALHQAAQLSTPKQQVAEESVANNNDTLNTTKPHVTPFTAPLHPESIEVTTLESSNLQPSDFKICTLDMDKLRAVLPTPSLTKRNRAAGIQDKPQHHEPAEPEASDLRRMLLTGEVEDENLDDFLRKAQQYVKQRRLKRERSVKPVANPEDYIRCVDALFCETQAINKKRRRDFGSVYENKVSLLIDVVASLAKGQEVFASSLQNAQSKLSDMRRAIALDMIQWDDVEAKECFSSLEIVKHKFNKSFST